MHIIWKYELVVFAKIAGNRVLFKKNNHGGENAKVKVQ